MRNLTRNQVELLRTALCLATLLISVVVLFGWFIYAPLATTVLPGLTSMKANTALALIAAAAGLLARSRPPLAVVFAVAVVVTEAVTLTEYMTGLRHHGRGFPLCAKNQINSNQPSTGCLPPRR